MADGGASRPVVLVTGASGGIGAALAGEFAAAGRDLVLVARRAETLTAVARDLGERHGVRVDTFAADLAGRDAGEAVEAEIARLGAHVDVLVNNAGFGLAGAAARIDREDQLRMIDLNIRALADLTLRFLPGMLARRSGGVLNVGSTAGFQPGPYMAGYYASKAFVASYTAALARECETAGVRFTNLAPGPVATGFAARAGMERAPLFRNMPVMTAETAARAGYRGFVAGRSLVVPGLFNRLIITIGRFTPARLRDSVVTLIVRSRH